MTLTRIETKGSLPPKAVLRKRLAHILASSEMEGVPMDSEILDTFRRFIDEGWLPQHRLAYLREKFIQR